MIALVAALLQPPTARDSLLADSARARPLAPVIVSSVLRTPIALVRAPYAVSVVGRDAIQRARAGLAVDEALRGVAGVQVDNRFNAALGERITVRGFGARTQFGVRGVKVLVDGIPATMPDGQTTLNHVDLGSLGRVEVERGPASALYGNAAGGVVLLETEDAPDAPLAGRVRALHGADGLTRLQGSAGGRGARGDWLATASRLDYDGFRQWSDQRSTRAGVRGRLGAEVAPLGVLVASAAVVDYDAHNPGGLTDSLLHVDPTRAFANNVRQQTGESGRHEQLGLLWRRASPMASFVASTFALHRALENPIPTSIVALDRAAFGARIAGTRVIRRERGALRLAHVASGVEWQGQRDDRQNYANATGARGALSLDQLERVATNAVFAQADATLGARLLVLGGLRHDRVRFRASDRLITATNPDDSGDRTLAATTPSIGASMLVGRGASVYANASTSFETPTTTELVNRPTGAGGLNPDLAPQRARSLEAGLKGAGAMGARAAGTWQLAAYTTAIRDALVPFEVPGAPGRQFYRNAGRARHRGIEASGELALGAWVARAAYTLVDARFVDYTVRDTSYAGRRVPGVSPRRVDAAVEWRGPAGLLAAIEQRAQDRTPATDANAASSPGFALTDARVALGALRARGAAVAPFAGVTNVFDRRYVTAVTVNAAGSRYFEPGAGRTIYVGADLTLGRAVR